MIETSVARFVSRTPVSERIVPSSHRNDGTSRSSFKTSSVDVSRPPHPAADRCPTYEVSWSSTTSITVA